MGIIDPGTYVVKIDLKITVDAVMLIEKWVLVKVQAISCMGREYSAVAAGFDPKALANSVWLSHQNEPNPNLGQLASPPKYKTRHRICI